MVCLQDVIAMVRRCCRWVVCLVVLTMSATPAHAAWQRLDSPNFVVVGDASERELRSIAVKFEAFREVLGRLRGNEAATAPVPTVILVFRSAKAFSPFTPRYQGRPMEFGGLFVPGEDVNYIAFVNDGSEHAGRLIHHEYAHLIIANAAGTVPVWLNEGLAEVYSTFELSRNGREAVIGKPIDEHILRLRDEPLLKLSDLLQVQHGSPLYNERDRRSVFYAQSWALVHMINFGEPSRTDQLRAYMQRLSEGVPVAQAWTQAFGAERIDRELERYVSRMSFGAVQHNFTDRVSQFQATAKPLTQLEVQSFLAQFLLAQNRVDEAEARLPPAAKADDQHPTNAVLAAQLSIAKGDNADAIKTLAGREAPDDWLMAYYAGVALSEAIERARDTRPEPIAAAGRYFDAATRGRTIPNATMRRASLELRADRVPADATILAVQGARKAAPGRDDYAFVHAQLLAHRSDFAAARSVLGPLLASGEPAIREHARSVMKWIVQLEQQHASRRAEQESAAPPPSRDDAATETPGKVQPVFRRTQPGEERVEGLLERIDCTRRGAVTFVLQTPEQPVRVSAPSMAKVEFITYRDDLTGNVTCGPLKEPMRVYVTSRASTQPDAAREVVAVEFLPKEMP